MSRMFYRAGEKATIWSIGDISKWDTGSVKSMKEMFSHAGYKANYFLDLSEWNVNSVTNYSDFNNGVTSKVTPPNWIN